MTEIRALDESIVPTVSVLLVTRLGQEAAFLPSLTSQKYDEPFEILVVEGGNRSQAKNLAIAESKAPLIAFIDADCQAGNDWLANLVSGLPNEEEVAGVGGVSEGHNPSGRWQKAIDGVFSTYIGTLDSPSLISVPKPERRFVKALSGHNSLFRREALVEVGGYDERFELNEDTDISTRLMEKGYKLILDRNIYVYHKRRDTPASFARQFFQYGVGRMRSMLTHQRYVDLRILGLFLGTILFATIALTWPAVFFTVSTVYFTVILISSVIGAAKVQSMRILPNILLLFAVEHLSYFAGMIAGLFYGPWSPTNTQKPVCRLHIERPLDYPADQ